MLLIGFDQWQAHHRHMIEIELEGEVGMVRAVDDVDHGIGGAEKKAARSISLIASTTTLTPISPRTVAA